MGDNSGLTQVLEVIGVCVCAPGVALLVTMALITALNRRRMAKDSRNEWLRRWR